MRLLLKDVFFIAVAIILMFVSCISNRHSYSKLNIIDSNIYVCDTVNLHGILYNYVDKESTDYYFRNNHFFINGDSVASNKFAINKDFYFFITKEDLFKIKNITASSSMLEQFKRRKKFDENARELNSFKMNGDKIFSFQYKDTFMLIILDVSLYKSYFWVNRRIKGFPKEGYIKAIVPIDDWVLYQNSWRSKKTEK